MFQRCCESPWQSCISNSLINTILSLLALFLPVSWPVVLVVLHHTFDANYIAPASKCCVNRKDMFAMDLLYVCYEDEGLLRSMHNDTALKFTTEYLISKGASLVGFEQLAKKTACNFQHYLVHFVTMTLSTSVAPSKRTVLQYCTNSTSFSNRLNQKTDADNIPAVRLRSSLFLFLLD